MSQWTHLNAAIRFDGIPGMTPEPDLGSTCDFEDDESVWDNCDVPMGSEGSIQYSIVRAGDGAVYKSAHIWGDLRNYDNDKEIINYLNKVVKGQMIRSGIAHIDVEGRDSIVLLYNSTSKAWEDIS